MLNVSYPPSCENRQIYSTLCSGHFLAFIWSGRTTSLWKFHPLWAEIPKCISAFCSRCEFQSTSVDCVAAGSGHIMKRCSGLSAESRDKSDSGGSEWGSEWLMWCDIIRCSCWLFARCNDSVRVCLFHQRASWMICQQQLLWWWNRPSRS